MSSKTAYKTASSHCGELGICRIERDVKIIKVPKKNVEENTIIVARNPMAVSRVPAIALQNAAAICDGAVRVTPILPCIWFGAFAKMKPTSKELMIGKGIPIRELQVIITS